MRISSIQRFSSSRIGIWVAILLAGFWVRLALYDFHSLEGDDGYSLSLVRLDTGELLDGLRTLQLDVHPPLHFLALKGWIAAAGDSLLSLRLMNIFMDTVIGALILRLAARIFTFRTTAAAGLLWLSAPLLIYSGYLIRMYTLLALCATAGAACIVEARHRQSRVLWYVWAACFGLMAAYTHIVGAMATAILGFTFVVDWATSRGRQWRALVGGWVAFGAAGALYLPYLSAVWALYRSGRALGAEISEAKFAEPLTALFTTIAAIFSHRALANAQAGFLVTVLLMAGSILLLRRYRRDVGSLLVMTWGGLVGMALLAWIAGFYKARYLTPFAPLVLVLTAGILTRMRTRWRTLALAAAVILGGWGVMADLDHRFRDDFVAAATFVQQHERPGDHVIIVPDWGQTAFQYHYHGQAPVIGLFPHVSESVVYADVLEEQTRGASRVWFVHYQPDISDPAQLVDQWFRARTATITEVFPAGMHVHYYNFRPHRDALPSDARPLDATFGDRVRLRGIYLPVARGSAQDTRLHPPSTWVQVVLYWEALTEHPDVTLRVRLTDPYAQVYGATLERNNDLLHREPPQTWSPGTLWEAAYDLNLNPATPPGIYNIEVMALDPSSGTPLPATGPDAGDSWVIAGQFVVD